MKIPKTQSKLTPAPQEHVQNRKPAAQVLFTRSLGTLGQNKPFKSVFSRLISNILRLFSSLSGRLASGEQRVSASIGEPRHISKGIETSRSPGNTVNPPRVHIPLTETSEVRQAAVAVSPPPDRSPPLKPTETEAKLSGREDKNLTIDLPENQPDPGFIPGQLDQRSPEQPQPEGSGDAITRAIDDSGTSALRQQTPEDSKPVARTTESQSLPITADKLWEEIERQLASAEETTKPAPSQMDMLRHILNDAFEIHQALASQRETPPSAATDHAVPQPDYGHLVSLETLSDLALTPPSRETLQALISTMKSELRKS